VWQVEASDDARRIGIQSQAESSDTGYAD